MKVPKRHDYECQCERCRAMWAAIEARLPNGEYFFTDDELFKLALEDE